MLPVILPSHNIDSQNGVLEARFEGEITQGELRLFLAEVYADPAWRPGMRTLLDFTQATINLHFDDMLSLTDWDKHQQACASGRWAFVVGNAVNFGMGRMYGSLTFEVRETGVFHHRSEAVAWLKELDGPERLQPCGIQVSLPA